MLIRLFGLWMAFGMQTLLAGVNNDGDDPFFPHAAPFASSRTEINALMRSVRKIHLVDHNTDDSSQDTVWSQENPPPFDTWQELITSFTTSAPQNSTFAVILVDVHSLPPMTMTGVDYLCLKGVRPNTPAKGFCAPDITKCFIESSSHILYPNFLTHSPHLKCLTLNPGALSIPPEAPRNLEIKYARLIKPSPLLAFPEHLAELQCPLILDFAGDHRGLQNYAPSQTSVGLAFWDKKEHHHPWNIPPQAQKPLRTVIINDTQSNATEILQKQDNAKPKTTLYHLPPEILHDIIDAFLPSFIDQWSLAQTSTWLRDQVQALYQNYAFELLPTLYAQEGTLQALQNQKFFGKKGVDSSMRTVRVWAYFTEGFPVEFKRYNRQGDIAHAEKLTLSVTCENYGLKENPISEVTLKLGASGDLRCVKLDGLFCHTKFLTPDFNPGTLTSLGFLTKSLFTLGVSRLFRLNLEGSTRMNHNMSLALLDLLYSDPHQKIRAQPLYYQVLMSDILSHAFYKMVRPEEPCA